MSNKNMKARITLAIDFEVKPENYPAGFDKQEILQMEADLIMNRDLSILSLIGEEDVKITGEYIDEP